ncbi:phosphatase PAP2 family protein [Bacillus sp. 7586-K]|uniref:phosphatase PAP2 family protein n=1 Tax=Metabacillus sp. 22489 TaxID=3453928 RepID=UPI001483B795
MKKWFFLSVILFLGLAFLYRYEFIYLIDVKITLLFETLRTTLLTNIFLFLSEVGSIKYMFPICIFFTILLLYKKRIISALFLFILLFSVRWINSELKELFSRERPHFDAVYKEAFYSFPSGHSMNSIAIYSFICYLFIQYIESEKIRKFCIATTTILIGLIGMSRIYLGVHYLTDVLAGFCAGFSMFIVISFLNNKINKLFDKIRSV